MHKRGFYGILFCRYLFVCLLLVSGEAASITSDDDSPYPVPVIIHSSSAPPPQLKYEMYDVFVSFRGQDIRRGFLSHLIEALSRKQIVAFVDYKLRRGDTISHSLLGAIERSSISLIIFSQNFASSHWCLEELEKIVECREKDGQILVPVFFKVDPADVRRQNGAYGKAFAELGKKYSLTRVLAWRSALKEAADISGLHSSNFLNDADLVEEIVKCVLMRLDHVHQVNSKGLIGIGKQISPVESLLQLESKDVRAIGIWGMSGIGKTTIAEEVFNRLCFEYEGCCFMANVREESDRQGMIYLKKKLFSDLLGEHDLKFDTPHGLPHFVERRLRRMKVLIVLDDVSDPQQLESLIGAPDWLGMGSRIIITTRDKQVLAKKVVDVYEVKALDFNDSLRLFNLNAFEQKHLEMEYYEMSNRMVSYANGIPLVLKVLGHLLHGKEKKIWKSQLERLKKVPLKKVHDVVRLSYNDLDRDEKNVFLAIACFLDGLYLKVDNIKLLLKDRGYSVDTELESLKNKALITISQDNVVSMHSIIQKTAWEIVREESIEDPGYKSQLLNLHDVFQVLKNIKGSEATRSTTINLWIIKELTDLVNLKFLILSLSSDHLVGLPDLSKATNLEEIDLCLCVGLTSVHPSVFSLYKLKKLGLGGCISLTSLQSNIQLSSLMALIKEFSVTSKKMVKLELIGIKQLPSSIGLHTKLEKLRLAHTYIENLPESIKRLTRLRHLDLRHCKKLRSIPELPPSLKTLDASGCVSLETVTFPSIAIQQLKENKKRVAFWNCLKLDDHSLKLIELNAQINMMKFAHRHVSRFGYDAQGTYVYPGSSVPEWLVYRTTHDHMTIDLSSPKQNSSQSGFIFGFVVPKVASQGFTLRINITVGEAEGITVHLDRPNHGIKSDHVYLMYDQGLSRYLNGHVKDHQPKVKIRVTAASPTLTSELIPLVLLRGFGVIPINTSQHLIFMQPMELAHGDSGTPTSLVSVLCCFLLSAFMFHSLFRNVVAVIFHGLCSPAIEISD